MTMMVKILLGACIVLMASTMSAGHSDDELDATVRDFQLRLGKLEAALVEKDSKKTSAFSATNRQTLQVTKGHKVAFPDVTLNHGLGGYNPGTGVFTAPADGLYKFQVRVTVDCKDCVYLGYLKKNGVSLTGLAPHDKDYYDGMTTSAITDLKKGDEVYLESSTIERAAIYNYTFSSFSGVMLEAY